MKEFLSLLGWLSLAGSLLGLAVWAVNRFFGQRLSRVFVCGLWALVLLRLVLPFGVPDTVSASAPFARVSEHLQRVQSAAQAEAEAEVQQQLDAIPGASMMALPEPEPPQPARKRGFDAFEIDYPEKPSAAEKAAAQAAEKQQQAILAAQPENSLLQLLNEELAVRTGAAQQQVFRRLFVLWAAGAALCAGRLVLGYALFRRRVLQNAVEPMGEQHAAFGCAYAGGRLRLVRSTAVSSAMVLGLLRPVVALPAREVALGDPVRLAMVLRHELTHYRRGDLWLKWGAALTACLHWFNPLVWVFERQIGLACELACDEQVICTMSTAEKQHYGETLLAFAAQHSPAVPLTAICEYKQQLKERLVNIMKYKRKGFFSILLCVLLAAVLAGCGAALGPAESESLPAPESIADTQSVAFGDIEAAEATVDESTEQQAGTVTVAKDLLEHYDIAPGGMTAVNGRIWIFGSKTQEDGSYLRRLVSFLPDGSDLQIREVDYPAVDPALQGTLEGNESFTIAALCLVDCGEEEPRLFWNLMRTNEDESNWEIVTYEDRLSRFDGETGIGEGIRLHTEGWYGAAFKTASSTTIWLEATPDGQDYFDPATPRYLLGCSLEDGSLTHTIPLPRGRSVFSCQLLSGERLFVQLCGLDVSQGGLSYDIESSVFYLLDPASGALRPEDPLAPPAGLPQLQSLTLPNSMLSALPEQPTLCSAVGAYRWDLEKNELSLLYRWSKQMPSGIHDAVILPDDTLWFPVRGMNPTPTGVRVLTPGGAPIAEDDRAVITVGGTEVSEAFRTTVDDFNAANADVRVELLDYSDAAAQQAGFNSGEEMLHRQLIQGGGPDIVLVSTSANSSSLYNKGLFVDLYPYIDADTQLSREDFFPTVLKAGEQAGSLPTVAPSFGIHTVLAAADSYGGGIGWDIPDFEAATAGCATPYYGYDRHLLLWYQLNAAGKALIDYSTGQAHLNSPAFVRLLEQSAAYPAETDFDTDPKELMRQKQTMLYISGYFSFADFPVAAYYFDGPFQFRGYPNSEGRSGSYFTAQWQAGIRSTCPEPDLAWRFLRELLLPAYQEAMLSDPALLNEQPLRRDAMQTKIAAMQREPRTPFLTPQGLPSSLTPEQQKYFSRAITQEECDALLELIDSTDVFFRFDFTVFNILFEESDYYYNGVRTAAETAAIIQTRVQTYLNEKA